MWAGIVPASSLQSAHSWDEELRLSWFSIGGLEAHQRRLNLCTQGPKTVEPLGVKCLLKTGCELLLRVL